MTHSTRALRGLGALVLAAHLLSSSDAGANKPADDFLNPQDPGPRISFLTFVGPGLRTAYDHRFELEEEVTELRAQVIGDVAFPFAEAGAHLDLRLFLLTFGASAGYHDEWRLLRFSPDYDAAAGSNFGRDAAGAELQARASGAIVPPRSFSDLHREARRVKDQNADVGADQWPFYEARAGFVWPGQGFMIVSSTALRHEDRPDASYDWINATVYGSGFLVRSETYAFLRDPRLGFIGPALRVLNLPRHRLGASLQNPELPASTPRTTALEGAACLPAPGVPCEAVREFEVQYGVIGGLRTNWVLEDDVLLLRAYTTLGLDNDLFGTHAFGIPLQLLVAYQMEVRL